MLALDAFPCRFIVIRGNFDLCLSCGDSGLVLLLEGLVYKPLALGCYFLLAFLEEEFVPVAKYRVVRRSCFGVWDRSDLLARGGLWLRGSFDGFGRYGRFGFGAQGEVLTRCGGFRWGDGPGVVRCGLVFLGWVREDGFVGVGYAFEALELFVADPVGLSSLGLRVDDAIYGSVAWPFASGDCGDGGSLGEDLVGFEWLVVF